MGLTATTILGICSIFIAFGLFTACYWTVVKNKPAALSVGLGLAAFIFMTFVPVFLAVFVAAPNAGQ